MSYILPASTHLMSNTAQHREHGTAYEWRYFTASNSCMHMNLVRSSLNLPFLTM